MRRSSFVSGMCLCLCLALTVTTPAQTLREKCLTGADIEKITGMRGIKLIPPGSVAGANGDLNFADSSGELILMVQITDAKNYAGFRAKYAKGSFMGVGDEAVLGAVMPGMSDNMLAFKKGTRCVVLTSFADFVKQKVYLTVDQLTALGKLIASRL
jgi:hypothetical protein